jgi:hypothetical protein
MFDRAKFEVPVEQWIPVSSMLYRQHHIFVNNKVYDIETGRITDMTAMLQQARAPVIAPESDI